MHPPIGFIVLSHKNPEQVLFCVKRLEWLFQSPPIVCHHDFTQSTLDCSLFPKSVSFVRPSQRTRWGNISLVHAFLAALRSLYDGPRAPKWFILLSAADYPLMPPNQIVSALDRSQCDLYLTYQEVAAPLEVPPRNGKRFFIGPEDAYDRYRSVGFRYPSVTRRLKPTKRQVIFRNAWLVNHVGSIPPGMRCYAGDHWFTANTKAAEVLLSDAPLKGALLKHYERRLLPEESFYHTFFLNSCDLRVHDDNLRYADWSENLNHPKTLLQADLDRAFASGCHFARKFDLEKSSRALSAIDEVVNPGRL